MIFRDYYKMLGLDTNKVSIEDIKNAFREQAKKYHPDVNNQAENTEERFKDINEAYKILSNNSSRRKYDRQWNARIGRKKRAQAQQQSKNNHNSVFGEFKNLFFGEQKINVKNEQTFHKKMPVKGENIDTEINIKLEDAFFGAVKQISLKTVKGKMATFNVKIPEGIRSGEKIRLAGQGKKGKSGGKNGDLLIRVVIDNNKKFQLEGYNLKTDVFISPWEAALGRKINIEALEGTITVDVPEGIQSGECIRIPQKGYKDGKGGRGDLIAVIKIVVPKELTKEEKVLYQKLKKISTFNPRG